MSLHISEIIERPVADVYQYASDPRRLPEWAAGLSGSIAQENGQWIAESPMGRVSVSFAPPNDLGVLDHVVQLPNGDRVYNPLRVIALGDISEVVFTLRRQPGASDGAFEQDEAEVRADLGRLKAVLEGGAAHGPGRPAAEAERAERELRPPAPDARGRPSSPSPPPVCGERPPAG